jgi:hypothetical protein
VRDLTISLKAMAIPVLWRRHPLVRCVRRANVTSSVLEVWE